MWRTRIGLTFVAGAVMLAGARAAASLDWPHVRGPNLDGRVVRETPFAPWPAGGLPKLWEQPVGMGFSGMTVAGGRVFTQHQNASGQELLCLDLATGGMLWRTRYAFPWEIDGRFPGPYGTPTIANGRVYFADCYGTVGCANASDGVIVWRFDAVKKLNPAGVDFGYAAAPLVMAGRLFAPAPAGGGAASGFCLDAATGALIWQSSGAIPSYASFMPVAMAGRPMLVLPLRNGVAIYDPHSGEELWKDEWTRGYDEHSCWPVFSEPYLFFPSAFRRAARVYRFAWVGNRLKAEDVWEERVLSNDIFSSALQDGCLYGFDVQSQQSDWLGRTRGSLKCVELATGKLRWNQTGIKHGSVTPVGTRMLLLEDEGDLVLFEPSPEAYRELARWALPQKGKLWATPVVVGDRLLIRGRETVACYALGAMPPPTNRIAAASVPPAAATATPSFSQRVQAWVGHHRSDAFIAPSPRVLVEWYAQSLLLLAIAVALGGLRRPQPGAFDWIWAAVLLGLGGTFVFSTLIGRFAFTAPLMLFALFCAVVPACREPVDNAAAPRRRGLWSVVALVAFVALCYGYYALCGWLFLVSGWGFLCGFPAVVILAWVWMRAGMGKALRSLPRRTGWCACAFTGYFWTSAVAILWSAK